MKKMCKALNDIGYISEHQSGHKKKYSCRKYIRPKVWNEAAPEIVNGFQLKNGFQQFFLSKYV